MTGHHSRPNRLFLEVCRHSEPGIFCFRPYVRFRVFRPGARVLRAHLTRHTLSARLPGMRDSSGQPRVFPITIRRSFGADPELHHVVWGPEPGPNGEATVLQLYEAHRHLRLKSATRPDEKPPDLPLIGFGAFDQVDRKGLGCREHNLNSQGMHAIGLDYDDVTPEQAQTVLRLAKQFSPEGLAHATWQHGLGVGVRMRVVLPLPEPVAQEQWGTFWHYANNALGAYADQQCKNIGRLYYLPCVNLDAPDWARDTDGGCWFESWGEG